MTVNWLELSSLMSSAMPMANVNLLCNEADKAAEGEGETAAACSSPVALEVRPRSRDGLGVQSKFEFGLGNTFLQKTLQVLSSLDMTFPDLRAPRPLGAEVPEVLEGNSNGAKYFNSIIPCV